MTEDKGKERGHACVQPLPSARGAQMTAQGSGRTASAMQAHQCGVQAVERDLFCWHWLRAVHAPRPGL